MLGTVLEVQARVRRRGERRLVPMLVDEIRRLEAIFSVFQAGSELHRWRAGPTVSRVSAELASLLRESLTLHEASGGVYNPAVGELTDVWKEAEAHGTPPDGGVLERVVAGILAPRYRVEGLTVEKLGDCSRLNFNAFAKGKVIDMACDRVLTSLEAEMLLVNIGGDLRHCGVGSVELGVENPLRPFDNEPPLTRAIVSNGGAATSGLARRGFRIGDRWYSHVLDPRTGQPVDVVASATVIARTAAQADGIATVLSVLPPLDGIAYAEQCDGVAAFVVAADGSCFASSRWTSDR